MLEKISYLAKWKQLFFQQITVLFVITTEKRQFFCFLVFRVLSRFQCCSYRPGSTAYVVMLWSCRFRWSSELNRIVANLALT